MTELGYSVPGTIEVQTLSWIEKKELKDRSLLDDLKKELHSDLLCLNNEGYEASLEVGKKT